MWRFLVVGTCSVGNAVRGILAAASECAGRARGAARAVFIKPGRAARATASDAAQPSEEARGCQMRDPR